MTAILQTIRVTGTTFGALVVYDSWEAGTATAYALDENDCKRQPYYAQVRQYQGDSGRSIYAAVFPTLPPANYVVYEPGYTSIGERKVTVFPGRVAEVKYT